MKIRTTLPVIVAGAVSLVLAGCSGSGSGDDTVEIRFLVDNSPDTVTLAEALAEEFTAANPDISVSVDTRPGGTEGDNLIKTRLSTGEMADVFRYNSGSLLQALNPDETLVDMSDQPWMADLDENFVSTVGTENGVYGTAWGSMSAGGMLYNRAVYADLGLEVPQSWDEFMANNEVIAEAGITPVIQTYGSTYTSQIIVLADFANVLAVDPQWAQQYTANNRKYADEPAVYAFEHLQELYEAGYFNENYPAATDADGARMLAEGEGAHYPMITSILAQVLQNTPEAVDDIGFFAIPAEDGTNTQATLWQPNALYVPKTTEGEKRDAALAFVEFLASDEGCALQIEHRVTTGPFPGTCELPEDAPPVLRDVNSYVDEGQSAPALEFLSPVKGPNLENIMVEVGSGITSAKDAAADYDQDVVNQARQLGLEGW